MAIVKYNGSNILYYDFRVRLFPGVNEVSEKDLKGMRGHFLFAHRFNEKILEVMEEDKEDKEEKVSKGKKAKKSKDDKRPEKEMLKLIPEIFDAEFLKKIIESDGRDSVVSEAEKQLHYLSIKAEDEEKKSSKPLKGK